MSGGVEVRWPDGSLMRTSGVVYTQSPVGMIESASWDADNFPPRYGEVVCCTHLVLERWWVDYFLDGIPPGYAENLCAECAAW